jgi:Tol biopolymer transport system component
VSDNLVTAIVPTGPIFVHALACKASWSREMRQHIAVLVASSVSISAAVQAGVIATTALAADDKAPERRGKIVLYADFLDEDPQSSRGIHVVDPATGTWTKVAALPPGNGVVSMHYLRVSPDGTEVAFNEYQQAKDRSHVFPASVWLRGLRPVDGPRKISDIGGRPIWSPDGKRLLLAGPIGGHVPVKPGRYATWRVNVDGSQPARLPIAESDEVEDWSPDGRWLAAVAPALNGGAGLDIVLIHPEGTDRRRLTASGSNLSPRFSPDGRRIAYVTSTEGGKEIWVVNIDGSHRRRIYAGQGDSFIERVAWSPDGNHLAAILLTWSRDEKGGRVMGGKTLGSPRLCILNLDDENVQIISHPPAAVLGVPDWR